MNEHDYHYQGRRGSSNSVCENLFPSQEHGRNDGSPLHGRRRRTVSFSDIESSSHLDQNGYTEDIKRNGCPAENPALKPLRRNGEPPSEGRRRRSVSFTDMENASQEEYSHVHDTRNYFCPTESPPSQKQGDRSMIEARSRRSISFRGLEIASPLEQDECLYDAENNCFDQPPRKVSFEADENTSNSERRKSLPILISPAARPFSMIAARKISDPPNRALFVNSFLSQYDNDTYAVDEAGSTAENLRVHEQDVNDDWLERLSASNEKERTLAMIAELTQQVSDNGARMQCELNEKFDSMIAALNERRDELLTFTRDICDRKQLALSEAREKCDRSKLTKSRRSSTSSQFSQESYTQRLRSRSMETHAELLKKNDVVKPLKIAELHLRHARSADEGGMAVTPASSLDSGIGSEIFCDYLEEGNLVFSFDKHVIDEFASVGLIEEQLSSPQLSVVRGQGVEVAIRNEETSFEIVTRNKNDNVSYWPSDRVTVTIRDADGDVIEATVVRYECDGDADESASDDAQLDMDGCESIYTVSFNPTGKSDLSVSVRINEVETIDSPFQCIVLDYRDFKFEVDAQTKHEEEWIVQNCDKIAILCSGDSMRTPSFIYGACALVDACAWRVRVTSACASLQIQFGVTTKCGISEADDAYTVHYNLGGSSCDWKQPSRQIQRRATSTRVSHVFLLVLHVSIGYFMVFEDDSNTCKKVALPNLSQPVYPVFSMMHNHGDSCCSQRVCPRPSIQLV